QEERSDVEEPAPLRVKTVAVPLTYGDCFFMHINIAKKNTKTGNVSLPTKKGRCCTRSMAISSRGRDALATQQARAAVHVTIHTRAEGAPVEVSRIVGAATTLHIREGATC